MAFLDDFKKFAFKGNVVDLAVGVVIGAAFGKIVSALVANLVMPLISLVMPSGDWRNATVVIKEAEDPKDNVVLNYGDFLGQVLDFFVVALVLFIVVSKLVKAAERGFRKPAPEPEAPATQDCPFCCETVPAQATRCKFCTSQLGGEAAREAERT